MTPLDGWILILALSDVSALASVERLGDNDFFVREAAERHLDCEWVGEIQLFRLNAARQSPDPEIRRRATRVLERHGEVYPTCGKKLPWISGTPGGYDAPVVQQYLRLTRWVHWEDPHPQDWPGWRWATRLYTRDLMALGWSRARVQILLDEMQAREREWWKKRNQR